MGVLLLIALIWLASLLAGLVALLRWTFWPKGDQPRGARILSLAVFWGIWILGAMALVAVVLPARCTPRDSARRRAICANNLRAIGYAMHNYHDQYGCFPPAYTVDERGRPLHSWRVLLLPYLEGQKLYDQLRLNELWISPHNGALLWESDAPSVFRCPSDYRGPEATSYLMVVGPETISDGTGSLHIKDVVDGTNDTMVVIETDDSSIHWAEPRDLEFRTMDFQSDDEAAYGMSSPHPEVINVLFADGTVHPINKEIDPELLRGLITIAGGEDVSQFWKDD